jgi:hypothetical protein
VKYYWRTSVNHCVPIGQCGGKIKGKYPINPKVPSTKRDIFLKPPLMLPTVLFWILFSGSMVLLFYGRVTWGDD